MALWNEKASFLDVVPKPPWGAREQSEQSEAFLDILAVTSSTVPTKEIGPEFKTVFPVFFVQANQQLAKHEWQRKSRTIRSRRPISGEGGWQGTDLPQRVWDLGTVRFGSLIWRENKKQAGCTWKSVVDVKNAKYENVQHTIFPRISVRSISHYRPASVQIRWGTQKTRDLAVKAKVLRCHHRRAPKEVTSQRGGGNMLQVSEYFFGKCFWPLFYKLNCPMPEGFSHHTGLQPGAATKPKYFLILELFSLLICHKNYRKSFPWYFQVSRVGFLACVEILRDLCSLFLTFSCPSNMMILFSRFIVHLPWNAFPSMLSMPMSWKNPFSEYWCEGTPMLKGKTRKMHMNTHTLCSRVFCSNFPQFVQIRTEAKQHKTNGNKPFNVSFLLFTNTSSHMRSKAWTSHTPGIKSVNFAPKFLLHLKFKTKIVANSEMYTVKSRV